ncbi:MAG: MFS transporter, partial [Acidimicrobiales bacterium]
MRSRQLLQSVGGRGVHDHRYVISNALIGLLFLASAAPSPFYKINQEQWHFSSAMLTAVFAIYALTVVLALNFLGPLADTFGRSALASVAYATAIVALIVLALAQGVAWLFIARALQGVAVGTGSA